MNKDINIVTHQIPWPPGFGGLIDIYYKIYWLKKSGYNIYLHCFTEGAEPTKELTELCVSVKCYSRKTGIRNTSMLVPYIVSSRRSKALIRDLKSNNFPIIFEGIHTTYGLSTSSFEGRKCFVRLFNVEAKYYSSLAKAETNFFKKIYFLIESVLLKRYENKIAKTAEFWALNTTDQTWYREVYKAENINFLPVFIAHNELSCLEGFGEYCLYHGNLEISENELMVLWLTEKVFSRIAVKFYIAGKKPSEAVKALARQYRNVIVLADPDDRKLENLIRNAHINVIPSMNNTGVKLKLINAIFLGRHCLVNFAGVVGSGLEQRCTIAETAAEFIAAVEQLMKTSFDTQELEKRRNTLNHLYNNRTNAERLTAWLQ